MRKELLDALKAKFEGVSDAVLGRIADKLAKTVTTAEQVKTAVEGVTCPSFLTRWEVLGTAAERWKFIKMERKGEYIYIIVEPT